MAAKMVNIPVELQNVSNINKLPIDLLNTPSGIYFLCLNNSIQYIGQAKNIAYRVIGHFAENKKEFDSVYYIECPIQSLDSIERLLISYFKPPLNKTFKNANYKLANNDIVFIENQLKIKLINSEISISLKL